ncbi:hypothetical protein BC827DRAFT_1386552, partial [Russula dissimulans]
MTIRFATGRGASGSSRTPEAPAVGVTIGVHSVDDFGAFPASPNNQAGGTAQSQRPTSHNVECHSSAISISPAAAIEPLTRTGTSGGAEPVVTVLNSVNPESYFVPSMASASEILTNVAIHDWFAVEDAEPHGLLPRRPTRTPMLASVVDSWDDAFEFSDEYGDPFACDWDEDLEESESPDSTSSSSSSSLGPVDSDSDDEGTVVIPVMRFRDPDPDPFPTIIEDDEEDQEQEQEQEGNSSEDEGDMSDTETILPSTFWPAAAQGPSHPQLPTDAGFDWSSSVAYQGEYREFP